MLGGKYMAIGIIALLLLATFKRFAVIFLAIVFVLWLIRMIADIFYHFKDGMITGNPIC